MSASCFSSTTSRILCRECYQHNFDCYLPIFVFDNGILFKKRKMCWNNQSKSIWFLSNCVIQFECRSDYAQEKFTTHTNPHFTIKRHGQAKWLRAHIDLLWFDKKIPFCFSDELLPNPFLWAYVVKHLPQLQVGTAWPSKHLTLYYDYGIVWPQYLCFELNIIQRTMVKWTLKFGKGHNVSRAQRNNSSKTNGLLVGKREDNASGWRLQLMLNMIFLVDKWLSTQSLPRLRSRRANLPFIKCPSSALLSQEKPKTKGKRV